MAGTRRVPAQNCFIAQMLGQTGTDRCPESNPKNGRNLHSQRECFYLPFPCGGFGGLEPLPWPWS